MDVKIVLKLDYDLIDELDSLFNKMTPTTEIDKMTLIEELNSAKRYTCSTCSVRFKDLQMYKAHYSTEWHRYNLHRKITNLPGITLEEFEKKNAIYRSDDKNDTKKILNCKICRKKYNCEEQYKNHLNSIKHKKNMENDTVNFSSDSQQSTSIEELMETQNETDSEFGVITEWYEIPFQNPIKHNYCLFCNHRSETIFHNLYHMKKKHSFFIPEEDYCDYRRLLEYLAEKIWLKNKCLWCNDSGRQLRSAEAARSHMIDKNHCKMQFDEEALLEYKRFYRFPRELRSYYLGAEDAELSESEDFLSDEELNSDEEYEMKLPSGKVIGHRSLVRYYKQNLKADNVVLKDHKSSKDNIGKMRNAMMRYNALDSKSEAEVEAVQKRVRDIQYLQRIRAKYLTQLQFKQNKLQKHFRPQINI